MIKRFHVLYVGQIDLDKVGLDGTPANDRRYPNERLSEVFFTTRHIAQVMDELRLPRVVDRRASLPARGLRVPAQSGAAWPLARHPDPAPEVRLRVQRAADVASDPAGRGLRDGRHRHRRPRHHGRRPRLPHARGGDVRRAADRCRQEPRILRGAAAAQAHARLLQPGGVSVSRASISPARPRWSIAATSSSDITMVPRPKHLPVEVWMPVASRQDHRHDGEVRPEGDGHAERREDPGRRGARLSGGVRATRAAEAAWART